MDAFPTFSNWGVLASAEYQTESRFQTDAAYSILYREKLPGWLTWMGVGAGEPRRIPETVGKIGRMCFVYGPRTSIESAGTLHADFLMSYIFVDKNNIVHPDQIFEISLTANDGRQILASRFITRSNFLAIPKTSGWYGLKERALSLVARTHGPLENVEARVCHINWAGPGLEHMLVNYTTLTWNQDQ